MRIYQGDSTIPGDPGHYTFIEITRDSFLEVDIPKLDTLDEGTKQKARAFVRKIKAQERRTNTYHIRMAYRFFATITPVPNLRLVGEF